MADDTQRLAVLIDADNAPASIVDGLFDEIASLGEASIRRIYGDFSGTRQKGWQSVLNRHAINAVQTFNYTTGKNASDIALVIDGMDMLHQGRIDGFCLVSSDSDFTRLASRAREQGMIVYGFGAEKTPEAFRNACNRFIYIENLGVSKRDSDESAPAPKGAATPPRKSAADAVPLIRKAMAQAAEDDGWYNLGIIGQTLGKLYPDFDPRTYGNAKLSTLVRKTGAFADRKGADGAIEITPK
jgi:uncharacterized LabA/DUF88 family protein